MKIEPRPQDSRVTVEESFEGLQISCPVRASWPLRLFIVVFLGAWLSGWVAGEIFAIRALLAEHSPLFAKLFLVVWVCGWTVGGIAAMGFMVVALLPPRPEILVLRPRDIVYGAGVDDMAVARDDAPARPRHGPRGMVRRRRRRIVPREQVGDVRLEGAADAPRLLVRFGSDEQEIGRDLTRADKEWLASLLGAWLGER